MTLAYATDPIPRAEYHQRRADLRKNLEGTLILFGYVEGHDEVYRRPQNSDFYYLTGWVQPGAVVLLTPKDETLFLPHRVARTEVYMGKRIAPEDSDAVFQTGFDAVLGPEKFESSLARAMEWNGPVYVVGDAAAMAKVKALAPFREVSDGSRLLVGQRMKKSSAEIAAIQKATDVSIAAHRAAWKRLYPGTYEYQAAATFTATLLEAGCDGHAYEPIFGSGPNSTVLHYSANSRRMDAGEVVVIDAAARCGNYTSDITRTLPIGGKFTKRQREVYDIVLGAQQAVIDAIKPGVELRVHRQTGQGQGRQATRQVPAARSEPSGGPRCPRSGQHDGQGGTGHASDRRTRPVLPGGEPRNPDRRRRSGDREGRYANKRGAATECGRG
jgi:Xaa-Pro aminopeptidase